MSQVKDQSRESRPLTPGQFVYIDNTQPLSPNAAERYKAGHAVVQNVSFGLMLTLDEWNQARYRWERNPEDHPPLLVRRFNFYAWTVVAACAISGLVGLGIGYMIGA